MDTVNSNSHNDFIILSGARQNNLKNLDVVIPKNQIVVFCGVSGSGKSSLLLDTLGRESLRQLYETLPAFVGGFLPKIYRPEFDSVLGLPPAVLVAQQSLTANRGSIVGSATDIQPLLRNFFARNAVPNLGSADAFSFNSPLGMCSKCDGQGKILTPVISKLIDGSKSLNEGALLPYPFSVGTWVWETYVKCEELDPDKKLEDYTKAETELLLYGGVVGHGASSKKMEGVVERFRRLYLKRNDLSKKARKMVDDFTEPSLCTRCNGTRFSRTVLDSLVGDKNIAEYSSMEVVQLLDELSTLEGITRTTSWERLRRQLEYLVKVGLGYLSLDRRTESLSGGELRRISIVRHLSSTLSGLAYILDEPTAGLHPADIKTLISLLHQLKNDGNTILIIEHNSTIINSADYVIELGPSSGRDGGQVLFAGTQSQFKQQANSLTLAAMKREIVFNQNPNTNKGWLYAKDICVNNLKNVSIKLPKFCITVVTGVAGAGKTTLMREFAKQLGNSSVVYLDQKPVISNRRSIVATFMGLMEHIRKLFSTNTGVAIDRFSFNSTGACEKCHGLGVIHDGIGESHCLCPHCKGMRYSDEILKYQVRNHNINDVLNLSVGEALNFFSREDKITELLSKLHDSGLSYVKIGQPLPTLSGGEIQRLKLAAALCTGADIFILDEPTTGLHMLDIDHFLTLMRKIVSERNNSVVIIEHDLKTMAAADWIIDVGPGAGTTGGEVLYQGPASGIFDVSRSVTGSYLKSAYEFEIS